MKEKFWESDPRAAELMAAAYQAERDEYAARGRRKELRLQAEARMREIVPSPEDIVKAADAADIYKHVAHGLYHFTIQAQPPDACLNHHCAFGKWVTDWVYLEYSLFTPQGPKITVPDGFAFVRVGFKVPECYSPTQSGKYLTGLPLDNAAATRWVEQGCARVRIRTLSIGEFADWSGPRDVWGGGPWVSLITLGPVHPSYLAAADNARRTPLDSKSWDKVVPPDGW